MSMEPECPCVSLFTDTEDPPEPVDAELLPTDPPAVALLVECVWPDDWPDDVWSENERVLTALPPEPDWKFPVRDPIPARSELCVWLLDVPPVEPCECEDPEKLCECDPPLCVCDPPPDELWLWVSLAMLMDDPECECDEPPLRAMSESVYALPVSAASVPVVVTPSGKRPTRFE